MEKRRARILWLAMSALIACALTVTMVYTRFPDITKETIVPVILESNGKALLAAWRPEKATIALGARIPIAVLSTSFRWGRFAQVPGTESLVWYGQAANDAVNNSTEYSTGLVSWNRRVLTPLRTFIIGDSKSPAASWWSGKSVAMTTARFSYKATSTSPLIEIPRQLIVTDSSNQTCSADLPHDPVSANFLTARGDLQSGFILIQWQARGESYGETEHLLLVRLQSGRASIHDVVRDKHFSSKDDSTWLGTVPGNDRFDWYTCIGQTLYVLPGKLDGRSNHVWTVDLSAQNPVVRLDQTLTSIANSLPAVDPVGGVSFLELTSSGSYLLFETTTNAWAVRNGTVVGSIGVGSGTLYSRADNLSVTRPMDRLSGILLPDQQGMSSLAPRG